MIMETRKMSSVLALLLMLFCLNASSQNMREKDLKKVGAVVFIDEDYSLNSGNMIILRLKDKSRSDDWKSGILVTEKSLSDKVTTQSRFPVAKLSITNFVHEGTPFSSISTADYGTDRICIDYDSEKKVLQLELDESQHYRRYTVKMVVFYKTVVDVYTGDSLGSLTDMSLAGPYLSQVFNIYKMRMLMDSVP